MCLYVNVDNLEYGSFAGIKQFMAKLLIVMVT